MVQSEVLVCVESMNEDKDNTDNQRHEVWGSLVEIQRVLHMERKNEEWELAYD